MTTMTRRPLPAHGSISRYKYHRCRCLTCCDGWRDYSANIRRQQAYGRWEPLIDAAPVRVHVEHLQASGLGIFRIAELAGVAQSTVSRLLYGKGDRLPQTQMQRAKAERILAVQADTSSLASGAFVDATGTRRRIQALVAVGFTHKAIAPHIGVHAHYVGDLAANRVVTSRHARAVTAAYDRLWNADPLAHGVTPAAVKRSRNLAAREGWPPPLAWDDDHIDDPACRPELGAASRRPDDTAADVAWLVHTGESDLSVIAARAGVCEDTVRRVLQRSRDRDVELAS